MNHVVIGWINFNKCDESIYDGFNEYEIRRIEGLYEEKLQKVLVQEKMENMLLNETQYTEAEIKLLLSDNVSFSSDDED
jgi:hypothetical protein